jgi:hypothetical protein
MTEREHDMKADLKYRCGVILRTCLSGRILAMLYPRHLAHWLVAALASAGMTLIAVRLAGFESPAEMMWVAVALLVAAALVTGVHAVARNRLQGTASAMTNNTAATSARRRREVLDRRLHVDPPRTCTQTGAACTMWSFCGSADDKASPLVERHDIADCPYDSTHEARRAPERYQRLKRTPS